jgi:hypothetical protein
VPNLERVAELTAGVLGSGDVGHPTNTRLDLPDTDLVRV